MDRHLNDFLLCLTQYQVWWEKQKGSNILKQFSKLQLERFAHYLKHLYTNWKIHLSLHGICGYLCLYWRNSTQSLVYKVGSGGLRIITVPLLQDGKTGNMCPGTCVFYPSGFYLRPPRKYHLQDNLTNFNLKGLFTCCNCLLMKHTLRCLCPGRALNFFFWWMCATRVLKCRV